jgi:hypothetical protein
LAPRIGVSKILISKINNGTRNITTKVGEAILRVMREEGYDFTVADLWPSLGPYCSPTNRQIIDEVCTGQKS